MNLNINVVDKDGKEVTDIAKAERATIYAGDKGDLLDFIDLNRKKLTHFHNLDTVRPERTSTGKGYFVTLWKSEIDNSGKFAALGLSLPE
jgi:hypothetical protein